MDYIQLDIIVSPLDPGTEILAAILSEKGFTGFEETEKGLRTFIPEHDLNYEILDQIPFMLGSEFEVHYSILKIEDKDWNELWEKSYEPVFIAEKVYIRAPFHDSNPDAEIELLIEPKMSFGTGHHETTYLMVEFLLEEELNNKKVLDAGCGTGILALIAERRGAFQIDAYDFDEWAYNNTLENIMHNKSKCIHVYQGTADIIPDTLYDIIVANINLNVILNDMGKFENHLGKGGVLFLSGFYKDDIDSIRKKATDAGLVIISQKYRNLWTALKLVRI